jgi:hypothetical protein
MAPSPFTQRGVAGADRRFVSTRLALTVYANHAFPDAR